ncbi:hypothetical protein Y032_0044g1047 [Ancylostoma ceylanicum]|uniref:GIY-YIG domain-containing protein n=1 Tax=Ancylostoma ceylanicum TaxID=53326 RepID=A0A016UDJ5_9BILA|nr:hypothetical protein Y032_0044g1047 [Ancylostoma ceylanicum]
MFKTAVQLCTGDDEVKESRKLASDIADATVTDTVFPRHSRSHTVGSDISRQNKVPLCLPFISDSISAAVRRCIVQAQLQDDVRLVNIPNENIRSQLVRNRLYDRQCISESCIVCPYGRTGDCAQMGVIYQLQCLTCSETYIGETGRTLGVRIKEHLADKRRGSLITPLGRHKHQSHGGEDFDVKCMILAHETETSARKTLEAFWISVRNPSMNNKNEFLSITNDFMPFVPLCEL